MYNKYKIFIAFNIPELPVKTSTATIFDQSRNNKCGGFAIKIGIRGHIIDRSFGIIIIIFCCLCESM